MSLQKIDNLDIKKITEDILLVHQIEHPFFFSCCDGLLILPKKGRNNRTISLDLNIEPKYVNLINKEYGPISDYVCSHGHLDHTCHVYSWEKLEATIHAPYPESNFLLDFHNFYKGFKWDEELKFETVEHFGKLNGYQKCGQVNAFKPGETLDFEDLIVKTISFPGHSEAHVGFLLPQDQVFHISCLGYDKPDPEIEGFGPWYGFEQCSILQYLEDIEKAKEIFLNDAKFLTSSHSYIVQNPDLSPFEYMSRKIQKNQEKVNKALKSSGLSKKSTNEIVEELLKMDLFFPKKKFKGVVLEVYRFWESWIIKKHLQKSRSIKSKNM
ncbi:MAG: MBL fold metallo-hydrolase [Promethearchaeota archaeon]|jgi:glyoxylase-like metal-dependent hydrolase (beta-lactamase superfamily II)